ncbi:MAG: hypothetical protein QMB94_07835 [Phycisphaerales bacterium]
MTEFIEKKDTSATGRKPSGVSTARMAFYVGIASASSVTAAASAGVVIVNLGSTVGSGVTIDLSAAVGGAPAGAYAGVISTAGGTNFVGGSSASNGSKFAVGAWFGASETVSANAVSGGWFSGGNIGVLAMGDTGYFGFRLPRANSTWTYGWIEASNNQGTLKISRWGYESVIGMGAATTGQSQAVPGMGGLAALACGEAGLRRSRKRSA